MAKSVYRFFITALFALDNFRRQEAKAEAEMSIESGSLVLRKVSKPLSRGWAEAAKKIAEGGDDVLVMGKFGNLDGKDMD